MPATNVVAPSIGSASIRILPDITGFGPNLSRELGQRAPLIAGAFGAALAAPLAASIGASIEFEDSFAAVRKTVEATEQELDSLAQGIRDMATEIPVAATQLNEIAAVAGQLGVEVGNLEEFTEVIAKLGVAADSIDPSTAATEMARFINITNGSLDEVDKLGAAIVDLGNKFPSTEAEILRFSQLIAGAGTVLGLTQADILGISNAVASAGIRAERGGSSISRLIMEIQQAALQGGPKLQTFAEVLGITTEAFQEMVANDPKEAIVGFIEAFGRLSDTAPADAIDILEDLDLNTIRVRDSLLRLGIASEVVRDSVETANTAFAEGTALNVEAEKRFATLASALKVLGNTLHEVFITVGDAVAPAIGFLVDAGQAFLNVIKAIPAPVLATGTVLAGLSGGAIAVGAAFAYSLQFIARLVQFLGPLRREAGGIIPLFKQMAFTVGETGTKAAAAASGIDAVRASASIAGRSLLANIGLFTAWGVAIAAVVTAFLLLKDRMEEVGETTIDVRDAVTALSDSMGPATEQVENFAGTIDSIPDSKDVTVSFAVQNQEAITLLRSLTEEGQAAFGAQMILQLLIDGRPPAEAVAAVQRLFVLSGLELPAELKITNAEDIFDVIASQGQALADTLINVADPIGSIISKINATGGTDFLSKLFVPELQKVEDAAASVSQTISNLVLAGNPRDAIRIWEDFEDAIRESNLDLVEQEALLKFVSREIGRLSGLADFDPSNVTDMISALQEFAQGGVDPFNLAVDAFSPESFRIARDEVNASTVAITGSLQTSSVAFLEYQQTLESGSVAMQRAINEYETGVTTGLESAAERMREGIPVLSEYSGAVDLELQKATDSILLFVQDEAKWTQLRSVLEGRLSTATLEALDNLSTGQRASFADAILGDDETAKTAALNYLSLLEESLRDPEALADLDLSDIKITDDNAFSVIPNIDLDSPIRIPPSVREQVGEDVISALEEAFDAKGMQGVFDNAADVYRAAADVGIDAFVEKDPGGTAILESLTGLTLPADVLDDLKGIGFDAASGVFEGFVDFGLADKISDRISGSTSGSVIDQIQTDARMQSPSKLFAEKIGLPIAQGIAAGVDAGAPEVVRSTNAIFDSIVPPSAPGMPSVGTTGAPSTGVVQNFNIAFNNSDIRHDAIEDSRRVIGVLRTAAFATPNGRIV